MPVNQLDFADTPIPRIVDAHHHLKIRADREVEYIRGTDSDTSHVYDDYGRQLGAGNAN
jgi:hypothetical protein